MIRLKQIYSVLLAAYILTSLLIPLESYNKLIFVVLVLIYGGYLVFVKKEKKFECLKITQAPVIIILIFIYGFIRGIANGADMALARQFLLATSVFVLIYPIEEFGIDLNGLLKVIAKIYITFFVIYVIYAINIKNYDLPPIIENTAHLLDNSVTRFIGETLKNLGEGKLSYRSFFGGKGIKIYLGSSPFLLILSDVLLIDYLKKRNITSLLWGISAVILAFLAGLRALMLLIPASICLLIWLNLERKKQIAALVMIGIMGICALVYLWNYSNFFSLSEKSNYVKVGHIISYFKQLTPRQALIGDGLASFYYSSGTEYALAHTEITLMDHCRYFGIPLAVCVWGLMVLPKPGKNWKIREIKEETVVFLLYLVFAQTNPVLFNSFGLIAVLWYWNVAFMKNKEELIL